MASKLLSRARAVSARLRHPRTLSPTLAAFAPKRLLSDVAPRPLPAAGDSPPASASPTPQSSGSAGKFKVNGKGSSARSSLKDPELVKFSAIADTCQWDSEGPFKLLHRMNPTRLAFICSSLCRHFGKDPYSARPFEGLKIVDVGCGGGLLSKPLARMGALVTGVDAVDKNIKIARIHAVDGFSQVMLEFFRCWGVYGEGSISKKS